MEMLRSLRGEKHELCLVVIKFKHIRSSLMTTHKLTYANYCYFLMLFRKCLLVYIHRYIYNTAVLIKICRF